MNKLLKILPYLDQMLVSGSHFLIGILLARALGIEGYGVFALIWMGVLFVSSIHQSLIITPAMTFAGKSEGQTYFDNLFWMQIIFGVLTFFSVILVLQIGRVFIPEWNQAYLIYLFPFLSVLYIFHDYFRKIFYITQKVKFAFVIDLIAYLPQIIGIGFLFFTNRVSLGNSIMIIVLSYLLSSLFSLFFTERKRVNRISLKESLLKHWTFSKWLTGKALLQWFSGNIFILAAGGVLGTGAVGIIRMAQNVTGFFNIFFLTLENSVPVKAAKIFDEFGFETLNKYLRNITIKGSWILGICIALIIVFAQPIIQLLYGPQSLETIWVFRGFILFTMLVFWGIPLRFAIRTVEETKAIFIAYFLSAIIGLVFSYPLVSHFEIWGVLLGLIFTQVVTHLYYFVTLKRLRYAENSTLCIGKSQP